MSATHEVEAAYRSRRAALIEEAREDEAHRRPLRAAVKRHVARKYLDFLQNELLDPPPPGLWSFEDVLRERREHHT